MFKYQFKKAKWVRSGHLFAKCPIGRRIIGGIKTSFREVGSIPSLRLCDSESCPKVAIDIGGFKFSGWLIV